MKARLLSVRNDERTDREVIMLPETHMAMPVLTRLYLLNVEQVTGRDEQPSGNRLHQLIAGHGKAIHIATAE